MTGTLTDFFGSGSISHLNLCIAIYADYPEWLRGIPKEKDLPRRRWSFNFPHKFIAPATVGEQAERVAWIIENLAGAWNITQTWVFFESDSDATKYRLVWD